MTIPVKRALEKDLPSQVGIVQVHQSLTLLWFLWMVPWGKISSVPPSSLRCTCLQYDLSTTRIEAVKLVLTRFFGGSSSTPVYYLGMISILQFCLLTTIFSVLYWRYRTCGTASKQSSPWDNRGQFWTSIILSNIAFPNYRFHGG